MPSAKIGLSRSEKVSSARCRKVIAVSYATILTSKREAMPGRKDKKSGDRKKRSGGGGETDNLAAMFGLAVPTGRVN